MHPWLLQHPPISTYGTCLLAGFIAAWLWARRRARAASLEPSRLDLLMPLLLAAGLAGAWLAGILTDALTHDPVQSSVLLGGLLAGTAVGIGYALSIHLPLGILGDLLAPPLALGVAIGRLGCFFAGCCYGTVCPDDLSFLAVRFPPGSFAALAQHQLADSLPVFPVQLFESALCLLLALALAAWRARNRRGITGQKFLTLALAYSLLRFALEFLRADNPPIGPFTFSQWTCLLIAALSLLTWQVRTTCALRWRLTYPNALRTMPPRPLTGAAKGIHA